MVDVSISQNECEGNQGDELEGNVVGVLKVIEPDKIGLLVKSEDGDHNKYGLGDQKISYREFSCHRRGGWGMTYEIENIKIIGENVTFFFYFH
jgi:hypothetical protein